MSQIQRNARFAGALYLLLAVVAGTGMFLPRLYMRGDAAATAAAIAASEFLFRASITTSLAGDILFLCVGVALYRLFHETSHTAATFMMALVVASASIGFVNNLHQVAALVLYHCGDLLSGFTTAQMNGLAMFFLRLHGAGVYVVSMFWGLWLFPLAWLIVRSRLIPKVLAILLVIAGVAYVATSLTYLLFPQYLATAMRLTILPKFAGELPFMFWLLIAGAKGTQGRPPQLHSIEG